MYPFFPILLSYRLAELVDIPSYKTVNTNAAVELVVHALFSVTGHDALNRSEVIRIGYSWGQLHRDIRCIDVTSIKERFSTVTDDHRPSR